LLSDCYDWFLKSRRWEHVQSTRTGLSRYRDTHTNEVDIVALWRTSKWTLQILSLKIPTTGGAQAHPFVSANVVRLYASAWVLRVLSAEATCSSSRIVTRVLSNCEVIRRPDFNLNNWERDDVNEVEARRWRVINDEDSTKIQQRKKLDVWGRERIKSDQ